MVAPLLVLASLAGAGAACSTTATSPEMPGKDGGIGAADGSAGADDVNLFTIVDAASGGACEASDKCPPGQSCLYPLSEACSATGVCAVLPASQCGGPYCTCRGDTTAACGAYGNLPMVVPLHGPPCGPDDAGGAEAGADGGRDGS